MMKRIMLIHRPHILNSDKKRIVYTGTIYAGKQDPSPLFAAIALLAKNGNLPPNRLSDFEVLFFGSPNDWLNSLIHKYKVEPWVKHMGNVSRDDVLSITKQSDMLLFLDWEDQANGWHSYEQNIRIYCHTKTYFRCRFNRKYIFRSFNDKSRCRNYCWA